MEGAEAFAKVLIDKLGLGAEFKVLAEVPHGLKVLTVVLGKGYDTSYPQLIP